MCMEDIKLGRCKKVIHNLFTVAGPTVQLCEPNADRVALIFGTSLFGFVVGPPDDLQTIEIFDNRRRHFCMMNASNALVTLTVEIHGQMVMDSWFAASANAIDSLSVSEVILEKTEVPNGKPDERTGLRSVWAIRKYQRKS